jgi:hypothetical protein
MFLNEIPVFGISWANEGNPARCSIWIRLSPGRLRKTAVEGS